MADTISVECPECERPMKVPADSVGKKARCKGCDEVFVVKAPKGKAAPAKKKEPTKKDAPKKDAAKPAAAPAGGNAKKASEYDDIDDKPYGLTTEYLGRRCPDCAEAMEDDDIICLKCGYNTRTREKAKIRRVHDITGLDIFLHLLPAILCSILVITLIVLYIIYVVNIDKDYFGDAWYGFVGGQMAKIYAFLLVAYISYLAGGYALKIFIWKPKPAEVEKLDSERDDDDD